MSAISSAPPLQKDVIDTLLSLPEDPRGRQRLTRLGEQPGGLRQGNPLTD
ncbi:MAG: hypothetical protein ACLPX8_26835 [Bryobacteraceae bacterium]